MIPTNLLVPTDFSPCAEHALDYACALAAKLDARIHVVNAVDAALPEVSVTFSDTIAALREHNTAALAALLAPRRGRVAFGETRIIDGDPRDVVLGVARELAADLIVIGTHGRRGLSRLLLGSVAEDIVRRAPCPVLAVRLEAPR